MATDRIAELLEQLQSEDRIKGAPFQIARSLSRLVNSAMEGDGEDRQIHELVLRAREFRQAFGDLAPVIDALVRRRGLYPYLEAPELGFGDLLAYELHRPLNLSDIVFHRAQAEVYRLLVAGENVILSAPTSFGKSLLIDAMIATNCYKNIVVVVPTISLIDETRRRLVERFRGQYKIITHIGQERAARNVFVLTQERVVEFPDLGSVDFFVIDEFYKLDPRQDAERAALLNQAFYKLYKGKPQFYLLGPNIRQVPVNIPPRFKCTFIATDFATVVSEVSRIKVPASERLRALVETVKSLEGPTLVYCASPASARRVATALEAAEVRPTRPELAEPADWAASHYHEDWVFVRALRRGIGLHHGRVPRSLQQFLVREFDEERLDVLVCTSTLIEGVNTKAKNVVIYDNKISTRKFDFFTFNNIKGRSGRMFEHFIGRVILFNDPPQEELPLVDIPLFTQPESTADSLLIQLDDADLSDRSRERMEEYRGQRTLSLATIRLNNGIDPRAQIALAEELASNATRYAGVLSWSGYPSWEQLVRVSELIWTFLVPDDRMRAGVASGRQLAFKINEFRSTRSIRRLILKELREQDEPDADKAVEDTLEFLRHWATFNFPRYLMAVDRIQREVFSRSRLPVGDYRTFAASVENFFSPAGVAALDEYGVPLQVALKLKAVLHEPDTLDAALAALQSLDVDSADLTDFERRLVRDAQDHI